MTDLEISKALALAIGWKNDDVAEFGDGLDYDYQLDCVKVWDGEWWVDFDYRDPAVIWPIAERYNAFPSMIVGGSSKGKWMTFLEVHSVTCATAAKAVALAVIGAKT